MGSDEMKSALRNANEVELIVTGRKSGNQTSRPIWFVEEDDKIVNPLGVKGMGELGMVGIAAAIANAVFHATGKRVRDLPITPEKLL